MKIQLSLVVGALALASCTEAETAQQDPAQDTATETALEDQATPPAAAAMGTEQFVSSAAASDMYEVEAGNMAQGMGSSDTVKAFGAMMVEGHTKSTQDLTAAAETEGVTVTPQMTSEQQANLEALRNAGDNFDTLYAQQQVAAHEMALTMLQGYAQTGEAEALKTFATNTAPVVEGHLAEARQLP